MDDIEYAKLIAPKLTTVKNDPGPVAEYLIRKLLAIIDNKGEEIQLNKSEPGEVIVRQSTRRI